MSSLISSSFHHPPSPPLLPAGAWFYGPKHERLNFDIRPRCSALSKLPSTQEYADAFQQNGVPLLKCHEILEDDMGAEEALKLSTSNEIYRRINTIKSMLGSMEDGEISISAYDTAWVALVEHVNGSGSPQFPSTLQWIANNQLPDGSWGDSHIFSAHDRIINTLACVIALKSWNIHPDKCKKGMSFFKHNIPRLQDEDAVHMPIGFEVAFPSLLDIARKLNIEVPEDSPVLQEIYTSQNLKLTKIPKDVMHNVPTTLLHSLEGIPGLEWEKLLKLQCKDGSFLFSPSSTAFAFMQTKDENCLSYLNKAVQRFKVGVPNVYPVDLFEHLWAVDRLQRLGISRYFQPEIEECVDYVHRYWSKDGICWARNSEVHDIDDTAMGFRILRLQGYDVSADVFRHFEKGGKFFCFAGQSNQAVTGIFNLYRACQVLFPGEKILEDAKEFSAKFLLEKQAANELLDKWVITKDLPGEINYALDVPWYASLPRVETRFYIEQYGGQDDVWIGKTLYRMVLVNNNEYLELAKLDYNNCQAIHGAEWDNFQKWYEESGLREFGISRQRLVFGYFLAAASIFEPERSAERLAWAKTAILHDTIHSYFHKPGNSCKQRRREFIDEFKNGINCPQGIRRDTRMRHRLVRMLHATLNQLSSDEIVTHGHDIAQSLHDAWEKWLLKWEMEGQRRQGEAQLLVQTINLTGGRSACQTQYHQLYSLINSLCHQLGQHNNTHTHTVSEKGCCNGNGSIYRITTPQIEGYMQGLAQLVLQNSSDAIDSNIKQTFLLVAKTLYYSAFCHPGTVKHHIDKVLFQRVR